MSPSLNSQRIVIWYRTDLRLQDHEPLQEALRLGGMILPCYCFDPRQFGQTSFGFAKTGSFRAQFLLESLADLRQSLQQRGSDLLILRGEPEQEIPKLVTIGSMDAVYFHTDLGTEEQAVEQALTLVLQQQGIQVRSFWGHTLIHPEDLPFPLHELPDLFTTFRKQVEHRSPIRPPYPTPDHLPPIPQDLQNLMTNDLPLISELGVTPPVGDPRALWVCQGGETAGKDRVDHYIWRQDRLRIYKETRNGMVDPDDSSKFSPWLAQGCLSPRFIYHQVQLYEQERIQNASTHWLIVELLWRDYFRWIMAKHGKAVFRQSGLQGIRIPWREDWPQFDRWRWGTTGFPLVDAAMRELAATGWMSNRGRQNVASFLTKNLGIHWQMGAEWFESLLIDYDVCSNWGNWNYAAGIGNDARGFRYFSIPKQSRTYDPDGDYLNHWIPELAVLPADRIHEPWTLREEEQIYWGIRLGIDYPLPIVDLEQSAAANRQRYDQALATQKRRKGINSRSRGSKLPQRNSQPLYSTQSADHE